MFKALSIIIIVWSKFTSHAKECSNLPFINIHMLIKIDTLITDYGSVRHMIGMWNVYFSFASVFSSVRDMHWNVGKLTQLQMSRHSISVMQCDRSTEKQLHLWKMISTTVTEQQVANHKNTVKQLKVYKSSCFCIWFSFCIAFVRWILFFRCCILIVNVWMDHHQTHWLNSHFDFRSIRGKWSCRWAIVRQTKWTTVCVWVLLGVINVSGFCGCSNWLNVNWAFIGKFRLRNGKSGKRHHSSVQIQSNVVIVLFFCVSEW